MGLATRERARHACVWRAFRRFVMRPRRMSPRLWLWEWQWGLRPWIRYRAAGVFAKPKAPAPSPLPNCD